MKIASRAGSMRLRRSADEVADVDEEQRGADAPAGAQGVAKASSDRIGASSLGR